MHRLCATVSLHALKIADPPMPCARSANFAYELGAFPKLGRSPGDVMLRNLKQRCRIGNVKLNLQRCFRTMPRKDQGVSFHKGPILSEFSSRQHGVSRLTSHPATFLLEDHYAQERDLVPAPAKATLASNKGVPDRANIVARSGRGVRGYASGGQCEGANRATIASEPSSTTGWPATCRRTTHSRIISALV